MRLAVVSAKLVLLKYILEEEIGKEKDVTVKIFSITTTRNYKFLLTLLIICICTSYEIHRTLFRVTILGVLLLMVTLLAPFS